MVWMAEGRQEAEWSRTAAVLATLWNSAGKHMKKGKTAEPDELNPYAKKRKKALEAKLSAKESIEFMAGMLGVELPPRGTKT
jgi:hypothetical protein